MMMMACDVFYMKKIGSYNHATAYPCPHCLDSYLSEYIPKDERDGEGMNEESTEFHTTPEIIAGNVLHEIVQNIMIDDNPYNKFEEVKQHLEDYSRESGFPPEFKLYFHKFSKGDRITEMTIVQEYIVNESVNYGTPRSAKQAEQHVRTRGKRFLHLIEELIEELTFRADAEKWVSSIDIGIFSSLDKNKFFVNGFVDLLLIIDDEDLVQVIEIKTGNPVNIDIWKRQVANYVEHLAKEMEQYRIEGYILHSGDDMSPVAELVKVGEEFNERWSIGAELKTPQSCMKIIE